MKSMNFVKKVGKRGTLILPKDVRNLLNIKAEDEFEVYIDGDEIILKKKPKLLLNDVNNILENETNLDNSLEFILRGLVELLISLDSYKEKHMRRLSTYNKIIFKLLADTKRYGNSIDESYLKVIEKTIPLIDIGKIGIPEEIFSKEGKLTKDEFKQIKEHPSIGGDILAKIKTRFPQNNFLKIGESVARNHHERWDGTGYPKGLSGEEIPLSSRIIAVVNVFDVLQFDRPYREAYSQEEAFEIIREEKGKYFDPFITDIFLENRKEFIDI